MSKTPAPAIENAAPAEEQVTLEEFCIRLSVQDKRVELIGGFEFTEKRSQSFKDTESAYRARYEAFINKPV